MIKCSPKNKKCVLAISFLDYTKSVGGMSKYMLAHEKMYKDAGYTYMSLYFVKKIVKKKYSIFHFYGLIVDGDEIGVFTIDDVLSYFKILQNKGYTINDVHIHNISYMNVNHMIRLAETLPYTPYKLILHDFHTICSNFNLLRNGIEYCGGKEVSAEKCGDCRYFKNGKTYAKDVANVLQKVKNRLTVIAPSEIARQIWLEAYPEFKDKVITLTEQTWRGEYLGNRDQLDESKPIVIGYLGNKSFHKGWTQWTKFVKKANQIHKKYKFIVFNSKKDFENTDMEYFPVRFTQNNLNAMTSALRKKNVDCAILWSVWPETYSYTLFEACSANVFILTNPNSGNIAYTVKMKGNGLVLNTEEELYSLAENPAELAAIINEARRKTEPGPELLVDNTNFVGLTNYNQKFEVNYRAVNLFFRLEQEVLLKIVLCICNLIDCLHIKYRG